MLDSQLPLEYRYIALQDSLEYVLNLVNDIIPLGRCSVCPYVGNPKIIKTCTKCSRTACVDCLKNKYCHVK